MKKNRTRPHRQQGILGKNKQRRDVRKREASDWKLDTNDAIKLIFRSLRYLAICDSLRDWIAPFHS